MMLLHLRGLGMCDIDVPACMDTCMHERMDAHIHTHMVTCTHAWADQHAGRLVDGIANSGGMGNAVLSRALIHALLLRAHGVCGFARFVTMHRHHQRLVCSQDL
eukprot:355020-Chlamydomonas_euryale.AAC.2